MNSASEFEIIGGAVRMNLRVQTIEDGDLLALFDQPVDQKGTNKPGPAGYQNAFRGHACKSSQPIIRGPNLEAERFWGKGVESHAESTRIIPRD